MTQTNSRRSPSGPFDEWKETLTFTFGPAVTGATVTATATMKHAKVGNAVNASPTGDLASGLVVAWARVSADNTVKLALVNAGANTTPGELDFDVSIED